MVSLQEKEEKLDERKERILREANEQAHAILRDTKEYADQTMKLFHKFQKDHVDTASVEKEITSNPAVNLAKKHPIHQPDLPAGGWGVVPFRHLEGRLPACPPQRLRGMSPGGALQKYSFGIRKLCSPFASSVTVPAGK